MDDLVELTRSSWGVMLVHPHPSTVIVAVALLVACRASWMVARR